MEVRQRSLAPLQWRGGAAGSRGSARKAKFQVTEIRLMNSFPFFSDIGEWQTSVKYMKHCVFNLSCKNTRNSD